MHRTSVISELHTMVIHRLFRRRPWLAERDDCYALSKKLADLGLQEKVPGEAETTRNTRLGNELNLSLIMVFLGLWAEEEMPLILEENGLMDDCELDRVWDLLEDGADPEFVLRPYVEKAYFAYYNPSGLRV